MSDTYTKIPNTAELDSNNNLSADAFIPGYATTATAAATTTLTVDSVQEQYFTGSTTQNVVLPVTSTLVLGQYFNIVNNSSGAVTVKSSGSNTIATVAASSATRFVCILLSGTTAASWSSTGSSGGGAVTLSSIGSSPNANAATLTGSALNLEPASASFGGVVTTGTQTFAGAKTLTNAVLVTPALGTPASGVATNLTGTAAGLTAGNVTTNANLTGVIISVGNATSIASQTGTGTKFVVDTSPALVTPVLGVASGTSLNLSGLTASQTVVTDGSKNLASLAYASAATASAIVQRDSSANAMANNFVFNLTNITSAAGTTTLTAGSSHYQRVTGSTTQTIVMPNATTLSNGHWIEIANASTGIVTVNANDGSTLILSIPGGGACFLVLSDNSTSNGSWSTRFYMPSNASYGTSGMSITGTLTASGVIQNAALTASQAVATDASKNLVSVATSGSGSYVLATSPTLTSATLVTPVLGTPSSGTISSCTGLPIIAGTTGTLTVARGGTAVTATPTASSASAFAAWDASVNIPANNHISGYATYSSNQTLTVASAYSIYFTGSTASQTITLPVVSTLPQTGFAFMIMNNASVSVAINSSGGNLIATLPANTMTIVQAILLTGTSAASWNAMPITYGTTTGSGSAVLADGATIGSNTVCSIQGYRPINAQTGTTYTLVLADAAKFITCSNASAITLTVPTNAGVAFVTGTEIDICQIGAGKVTIAAAGGVTINSLNSVLGFAGQYAGATLKKTASDTWLLFGAIVA